MNMKKIVLTENQVKMLQTKLNENSNDDNRYRREVKVNINSYGQKYKGMEVSDVSAHSSKIYLNYLIEMEHRSWGIKNISLYDIKGPTEIEASIDYYTPDGDDTVTEDIVIPLNWEKIETDTISGNDVLTLGDELDITLNISPEGHFDAEMIIEVYSL